MEPRVAFVSTFPPRRCGIATFARDLSTAVGRGEIVALHRSGDPVIYPLEVTSLIRADRRPDYAAAARAINASGVGVVSLQHEYGIFGGPAGAHVLDLLDLLDVPVVATLHTVLHRPDGLQRAILDRVLHQVAGVVVMSRAAAAVLREEYGAGGDWTHVIPHGVPDLPLVETAVRKPGLGLAGRSVILSFGLLGPGKGYELAIEAMARVRRERPDSLYVILGVTHPDLVRTEGEAYRDQLRRMVVRLRLQDHVRFEDRFVGTEDLGRWLQAADVVVTPYPNLEQIVSGTLSYALAAGRPVVSTPFAYAAEVLADGRGIIVPPSSSAGLAAAVSQLLRDDRLRSEIGRRAHDFSRRMVWREVGADYRALFARIARPSLPAAPDVAAITAVSERA